MATGVVVSASTFTTMSRKKNFRADTPQSIPESEGSHALSDIAKIFGVQERRRAILWLISGMGILSLPGDNRSGVPKRRGEPNIVLPDFPEMRILNDVPRRPDFFIPPEELQQFIQHFDTRNIPAVGVDNLRLQAAIKQDTLMQQRQFSELIPELYEPNGSLDGSIEQLERLFRSIPHIVGSVEIKLRAKNPSFIIVFFKDMHFQSWKNYLMEVTNRAERSYSEEELLLLYENQVLETEIENSQQEAILRVLIRHGVHDAYTEGFTDERIPGFQRMVASLRKGESEKKKLVDLLGEYRQIQARLIAEGYAESRTFQKLLNAISTLELALQSHRLAMLAMGPAGGLLVQGELNEVHPADDEQALSHAVSLVEAGLFKTPAFKEAQKERDKKTMQKLRSGEPGLKVLIMGGAHSYTEEASKAGDCSILELRTQAYMNFAPPEPQESPSS